jgi:hypothetical protein
MPMASDMDDVAIAFAAALKRAGLSPSDAEAQALLEGYRGLQGLLARIPRDLPVGTEPDTVAVLRGGKVVR